MISYQYAILTKDGICFKCLLYTFSKVSWNEIMNITVEREETASNNMGIKIYKNFIYFLTKDSNSNKHNKIIYTQKNCEIIKGFIKSNNINIDLSSIK